MGPFGPPAVTVMAMATAVIQARMASTRLPGKVLKPLGRRSMLGWVIRAAQQSDLVERVVVATSTDSADDAVVGEAIARGAEVARGPLDDVLKRFVLATADDDEVIVRLTADCPLLDPTVISMAVGAFGAGDVDYVSTIRPRSLPRGLDVEVFSRSALLRADQSASGYQRVHVTPYLYESGLFAVAGLVFTPNASNLRVTVDTAADLAVVRAITEAFGGDSVVPWRDQVRFLLGNEGIASLNAEIRQKELHEG